MPVPRMHDNYDPYAAYDRRREDTTKAAAPEYKEVLENTYPAVPAVA